MISPMLCKDNLDKFLSHCGDGDIVYSEKLDGVRCLARIAEGKVTYWSRNGKEFPNFQVFTPELLKMVEGYHGTIVFDGEVIATDKSFNKRKPTANLVPSYVQTLLSCFETHSDGLWGTRGLQSVH
jgi:ATP-dependent DNA ligase